jgi:carboxylesterase
MPAITQLLDLQQLVRDSYSDFEQPVIIFQSWLDQTIDPDGAQELFDRVQSNDKQLIWLQNSGHHITLDAEWEIAAEKTAEFVRRILSNQSVD